MAPSVGLTAAACLLCPLPVSAGAGPQGATIFLNSCKPSGCFLQEGSESSINNKSSIIIGNRTVAQFAYSDEAWARLVTCVQEVWAPFDVTIVDVDPAPSPHLEQLVAGLPANIGQGPGVGGVSPYTCSFIPNSISFAFANIYGDELGAAEEIDLCWTASQELAHQFGLDHEAHEPDPMTYIAGCGRKDFAPVDAPCGEYVPRACVCGGSTQNSYAAITALTGPSEFIFRGTFDDFDADWICDWSAQQPPPAEPAPGLGALVDFGRPRCATFDPENRGLRLPPRAER